jgi:hypothetical protein
LFDAAGLPEIKLQLPRLDYRRGAKYVVKNNEFEINSLKGTHRHA